jgi:hypothetical protein
MHYKNREAAHTPSIGKIGSRLGNLSLAVSLLFAAIKKYAAIDFEEFAY